MLELFILTFLKSLTKEITRFSHKHWYLNGAITTIMVKTLIELKSPLSIILNFVKLFIAIKCTNKVP
jgi:hypothetical protein